MTPVRNETQRHNAVFRSAGKSPICLLPLYSANGLRRQVAADAADVRNFGGHNINGADAANDAGPVVCALAITNAGCTEVGHYGEALPDGESCFVDFLAYDSVGIAQGFQAVTGNGAKAANAQAGPGKG